MQSNECEPKFEHNCKACRFLGTFEGHDLYFCKKQDRRLSSVIARFGSDGPEYISVPICVPPPTLRDSFEMQDSASSAALRVAYLIAIDTFGGRSSTTKSS